MIYLSIPKGMVYKQMDVDGVVQDVFVSKENSSSRIYLQKIVKEVLRTNSGKKIHIHVDGLDIYFRATPRDTNDYLAYQPEFNGKYPTKTSPQIIKGYTRSNIASTTQHGSLWYQNCLFSTSKLATIEAKREEQRDNRRHTGDAPCGT